MKSKTILSLLAFFIITSFVCNNSVIAQDTVPTEVTSIIKMKLDEGQEKLESLGYEMCSSSMFGKKQDWYNESAKICITVHFNMSKKITEVLLNPEISECQEKLEAMRKVWENYHDGQAPINSSKIDEERKKLIAQGFKVSYWINDVSPGRAAEYWVNETKQKVMFIVWEIQGNKWVMTKSSDYSMGKNPALNRN